MTLVFGGVLIMLYFMFESFGIGEYVWPILIPIFGWTFVMMVFICGIVGVALRVGGGIPSDQTMIRRTYVQPPSYPKYERPSTGSVYVIPVYCPHCMNKLDLDNVEWIGSGDLICPSCQRTVQVGVRENF
jgi:hypothetical protein